MELPSRLTRSAADRGGMLALVVLVVMASQVHAQEDNPRIAFLVYEETPSATYITEIPSSANLPLYYAPEQLDELRYSILPSSQFPDFFSINEVTGDLRTAEVIDREAICTGEEICTIDLDIGIQPRKYFRIIKLVITVVDVNDNSPSFLQSIFERSIAENTAPGASFAIPSAEDNDSPAFGVKNYELIVQSPQFQLKMVNTSDGGIDVYLVLTESVDREMEDMHSLVLAAYDGGTPPNVGTLPIEISIQDVNDNQAYFLQSNYEVTVPESEPVNTVILRVQAQDDDDGINGQILYGFSSKTERSHGDRFSINNATGEIIIKSALSYEISPSYNLAVTARDMNPDSLAATATVMIQVQDVNDHAPEISISALTETGHVEISEGEPIGTFVAFISASDRDSGQNGEFDCSMINSAFEVQTLSETEYKIVTSEQLDHEMRSSYDLVFNCYDKGQPVQSSSTHILVSVIDENDNDPQFDRQTYSVELQENNAIGKFLVQVRASDADSGANSEIEYSIVGGGDSFLNIDPTTGNITARISFDFEQAPQLEFTVSASDRGTPPRSSSATLLLILTDIDDNMPSFTQLSFAFDVFENKPLGTLVGLVQAHDPDSFLYNQFSYELDPTVPDAAFFQMDPSTGTIFTKGPLDREAKSQYALIANAVNTHDRTRSSSAQVTIFVADENDEQPYVIFPNEFNRTMYVASHADIGTQVGQIIAGDNDIGVNAKLTYLCTHGNEQQFFTLNNDTGIIYVKSKLIGLDENTFTFDILIHDRGYPQYRVETHLNIYVNRTTAAPAKNHNLIIVISVVVISGLLTFILMVAIVVTRQQDKKKKSLKYVQRIHSNAGLIGPGSAASSTVSSDETKGSQKMDVSFGNEVVVNDSNVSAKDALSRSTSPNNSFSQNPPSYSQVQKKRAMSPSNASFQQPINQAYQTQCQPGPRYQAPPPNSHHGNPANHTAGTSYPHYNLQLHQLPAKDKDADSTSSEPMSNTDSGRGSNEDPMESRPSPLQRDSFSSPRDGVVLRPPQTPTPTLTEYPNLTNDSFTGRLNSIIQSKPPAHPAPPPRPLAKAARPSVSRRPPPPQPPRASARSPPPTQELSNPTIPVRYPVGGSVRFSPSPSNVHINLKPNGNGQQPYPSRTPDRFDGRDPDSSFDNETEGDWSDEDKEYVYYVNASHV